MDRSGFFRLAAALACLSLAEAYPQTYVVERPNMPGQVDPRGINASGIVAGSTTGGAFIYDGVSWNPIGTLGGQPVTARMINASSEVVGLLGNTFTTPSPLRAFYWSASTGMLDMGSLQVGGRAEVRAINSSGQAVGISLPGLFPIGGRPFLWTLAGGMVDLGTLGGAGGNAFAINYSGQVVGTAQVSTGQPHAFLWTAGGGMYDLGTLGGTTSSASDINDLGHVVGNSTNALGQIRAYRWTPEDGMVDLGGVGTCSAQRITNLGHILGQCARPFVWTPEDGMVELVLGDLIFATSMNAAGTVVGGVLTAGQGRGFIYDKAGGLRYIDQHLSDPTLAIGRPDAIGDDGTIAAHLWPSFELVFLRLQDPAGSTPTGADVEVSVTATLPGGGTAPVQVTFPSVTGPGVTSVTASDTGPALPSGFKLGNPPLVYDVNTTATYSGQLQLCFSWNEGQFANEDAIALLHFETGAWRDITTSLDTVANVVCGTSASLSPFAITEIAFAFTGFYQPVSNLPLFNPVRAGSAVPIKFSLGGFRGLGVVSPGYPVSSTVACGSSAAGAIAEEAASSGGSGLTYDPSTDQYKFVWKTEKGWSGCRQFQIRFTDGTVAKANFEFR